MSSLVRIPERLFGLLVRLHPNDRKLVGKIFQAHEDLEPYDATAEPEDYLGPLYFRKTSKGKGKGEVVKLTILEALESHIEHAMRYHGETIIGEQTDHPVLDVSDVFENEDDKVLDLADISEKKIVNKNTPAALRLRGGSAKKCSTGAGEVD